MLLFSSLPSAIAASIADPVSFPTTTATTDNTFRARPTSRMLRENRKARPDRAHARAKQHA
eukprot:3517578-Rhodomonas_salina.1